ncbi:MAG TPA: GGDEF domain-containing protein [Acidimicrobiia bacterium]|nr:GGDEF domain-containing protein [Acidimicrobiia bacterium]
MTGSDLHQLLGVTRRPSRTRRLARREIAPHRQVMLLWLLTVVMVAAAIVTGSLALGTAERATDTATTRFVPASAALTAAIQNYGSGSAALETLVQSPDNGAVAAGATQLTALNNAADTAWKNYERSSANLPGEAKLRAKIDAETGQIADQGVALLAEVPRVPASAVAAFTALADQKQVDMGAIQVLYQHRIDAVVVQASHSFDARHSDLLIVSIAILLVSVIAFGIVIESIRRRYRVQLAEVRRNELESGLQRALELVRTEPACSTLIQHAIERSSPELPCEFLVADSSRAHFHQVITTDPGGGPGCPVMSPDDCPATSRGQTQIWPSSTAIDACPHLSDRDTGDCSAVCVPVSIAGKTIGVLHATGPDERPPESTTTADLELVARKAGERIGIIRAFSRSEAQARTDPLTGLLNRRSLEAAVRDLTADAHPYAVAYGDLDHFKLLNDIHGHDTGDRALRLFARVLRDSVRPNDIAARYGGEEFVVVLPDCTITDAYTVIDRVRSRLADAQHGGSVPSFTVSFGLALGQADLAFGETVELADAALLRAKSEGRDRVVLDAVARDMAAEAGFASPSPPTASTLEPSPQAST